jgi:hypothetical protein
VVSQPGAAVQSANPLLQLPCAQLPVAHEAAAFGKLHGVAQSPQSLSVLVAVSQPLLAIISQLLKPVVHCGEHPPVVHVVMPWGLVQASPHERQSVSVPSGVSQPGAAVQSP